MMLVNIDLLNIGFAKRLTHVLCESIKSNIKGRVAP